ncbi:hypothetical protein ACSBL2_07560 [Pedobacter sp. AW31-3R]|uniref:hypothetical protein n=1 Tax=Pedobacter sp. AW31-3R TaxID=3445781 RepID=UPI003F9F9149
MKLNKHILRQSAVLGGLLFLFACQQSASEKAVDSSSKSVALEKVKNNFPFYKNIVVKPGHSFEVVSWGKGVDSVGGYLLLMSDSVKNNYKSFSVEREGIITDAWNMDMDNDGNPELYIELLSKKNVKDLNVYEYSGNSFNKITFPPLSSKTKKTYGGNDKFMIKNGDLFRTFPIVNSTDTTEQNGKLKILHYSLRGNSFSVEEVSE